MTEHKQTAKYTFIQSSFLSLNTSITQFSVV